MMGIETMKTHYQQFDTPPKAQLIVPIDVTVLCIGADPGAIFTQTSYDYSKLVKGNGQAYLSSAIQRSGNNTLQQGVHLHWALPDILVRGEGNTESVIFPPVPDCWLVTRMYSNPDSSDAPTFSSWVIESGYYSPQNDNPDKNRLPIFVPYTPQQSSDGKNYYRHLGKVSTLEEWLETEQNDESYISGLTALGHGVTDFAAYYPQCQSIFGFVDLADDLEKLGIEANDKYLTYHVVGWYSDSASNDPIRQLPSILSVSEYNTIASKIVNEDDKSFFCQSYIISPSNDNEMICSSSLSSADKARLYSIMLAAGYDFFTKWMQKAQWSLPSSDEPLPTDVPDRTVYSGMISDIIWNTTGNYFTDPSPDITVAVGNTHAEALSALIANTITVKGVDASEIERILNVLQIGMLGEVMKSNDSTMTDEKSEEMLHKNSFQSRRAGTVWEVKRSQEDAAQQAGEITLPPVVAEILNQINILQQQYDDLSEQILSFRQQIFADWYCYMLQLYPVSTQPPLSSDIETFVQEVDDPYLNDPSTGLITQRQNIFQEIQECLRLLQDILRKYFPSNDYEITKTAAPRYYKPQDPVILLQGESIIPTDRFGNDGRYMYDDTLLCRLNSQLISSLSIPINALGNTAVVNLDSTTLNILPTINPLLPLYIQPVIVDAALQSADVLAAELRMNGNLSDLETVIDLVQPYITQFLQPNIPPIISLDVFNGIISSIASPDAQFLQSEYSLSSDGKNYTLNADTSENDILHIQYILNSAFFNPSSATLQYVGIPISLVGVQYWSGSNPWMPFKMRWEVHHTPFFSQRGYTSQKIITDNFSVSHTGGDMKFGGVNYPSPSVSEDYSNSITLTPHATINLQQQLQTFIQQNPSVPQKEKEILENIVKSLDNKPTLAQSLSGFHDALLMLHQEQQLPVADINLSTKGPGKFSNVTVPPLVGSQNLFTPKVAYSVFNPIRAGLATVDSLTVIDVFGRSINFTPGRIICASTMQPPLVSSPPSVTSFYLAPRLTQASRLLFRWRSADDDTVEMNTHPATTPICGWVLVNHLDHGLWVYDNQGVPLGSLILSANQKSIIWQCAPGSVYFGLSINEYFEQNSAVNVHLKNLILNLYGDGGQIGAAYLSAFLQTLDASSLLIEPSNYQQYQSNAVLIGKPFALVRASLDLDLMGLPAQGQSMHDLQDKIDNSSALGNNYGFTKVTFPVELGNLTQTEDGLIGYFKDDTYSTFYAPAAKAGDNNQVIPPPPNNILLTCDTDTPPTIISMLVEPRGKIHASTGILPVKAIEIPPDQYLETLQRLQLSFLTSPILTPTDLSFLPLPGPSEPIIAMPLPSQQGGAWSWIENDGTQWTSSTIVPVITDATMNYSSQSILEGWLVSTLQDE